MLQIAIKEKFQKKMRGFLAKLMWPLENWNLNTATITTFNESVLIALKSFFDEVDTTALASTWELKHALDEKSFGVPVRKNVFSLHDVPLLRLKMGSKLTFVRDMFS